MLAENYCRLVSNNLKAPTWRKVNTRDFFGTVIYLEYPGSFHGSSLLLCSSINERMKLPLLFLGAFLYLAPHCSLIGKALQIQFQTPNHWAGKDHVYLRWPCRAHNDSGLQAVKRLNWPFTLCLTLLLKSTAALLSLVSPFLFQSHQGYGKYSSWHSGSRTSTSSSQSWATPPKRGRLLYAPLILVEEEREQGYSWEKNSSSLPPMSQAHWYRNEPELTCHTYGSLKVPGPLRHGSSGRSGSADSLVEAVSLGQISASFKYCNLG